MPAPKDSGSGERSISTWTPCEERASIIIGARLWAYIAGDGTRQVPPKFNFAIIRARYSSLGPFSPYRETSSKIMQITIFVSRVSSSIEATGAVLDESDDEDGEYKGHFCSLFGVLCSSSCCLLVLCAWVGVGSWAWGCWVMGSWTCV